MKVFVAGGAGFLGSHVCEYYRSQGCDVVAYDNFNMRELSRTQYDAVNARKYMASFLQDIGVTVIKGDVLKPGVMDEFVKDADFIVNCSAQPAMTIGIEDPILDHHVNVGGTINLLEAARKYSIPMLHCSTIHIYGNQNQFVRKRVPVNEDMPILEGTVTPLHASKMAGEHYCRAYADTYGVKSGVFRLTGMYGPRQFGGVDHGWVANFCIRHIMNQPITVFGTMEQFRDILYVTDAVRAIEMWRHTQQTDVFNIGGPLVESFKSVFDILEQYTGRHVEYTIEPGRVGDLHWFACNIEKAKRYLGWSPRVDAFIGVPRLCKWVEENRQLFR